jgi:5-methylcytosine-specific restriction enzyme A
MFVVGNIYNRRQDIHRKYGGQAQGGISSPSKHLLIFIFTGPSGEAYGYRDEFKPDGTFTYTGEGQVGDMQMVRGNRAIREHTKSGRSMHLFEQAGKGRVRYMGEATYLGHHLEQRPDIEGNLRNAIVFELDVNDPSPSVAAIAATAPAQKPRSGRLWSAPLDEVRRLARERPKPSAKVEERRAIARQRSEAVRVYVLRRAAGNCEACKKPAPFETGQGRPYLEPHHIRRIADGGPDEPRWVAAVCPNCHREAHYGKSSGQLNASLGELIGEIEVKMG